MTNPTQLMKHRFDGYLPIVIDVETAGLQPIKDALLEIAAFKVLFNESDQLYVADHYATHVEPFEGARLDPKALEINQIDPYHPFRFAVAEQKALTELFKFVNRAINDNHCRRAVLVGHNAHFDLSFIVAAANRCKLKNPFHAFTVIDTATLSGLVYGKTVLAKALKAAKISFNKDEAHSAIYDAKKTAELFCQIINGQQYPHSKESSVRT